MKTLFDAKVRDEVRRRVESVRADAPARWGKMDAPKMLQHLAAAMSLATGEVTAKPRRLPLRFPVIKHLVIYLLPFPKGAPTAPELLNMPPGDISANRTELLRVIDKVATQQVDQWPDHPAFGKLSRRDWGVLGYRHIDHHLRQFGA